MKYLINLLVLIVGLNSNAVTIIEVQEDLGGGSSQTVFCDAST